MESVGGSGSNEVENDLEMKLLRDRFRLSAISIAESEGSIHFHFYSIEEFNFLILVFDSNFAANKSGMEVSKVVVACVADLAFKYTGNSN